MVTAERVDPDLMPIERQRAALMQKIKRFYEGLTGSECEAKIFCVAKTSVCGYYFVHRLHSCDFYELKVKRETPRTG